jgi:hypothetical protein
METKTDFFDKLTENNILKISSFLFLIISCIVSIPASYGIIWFEKFGSDHRRTIVNRLVSSMCWTFIIHICFLVHLPEMFRYMYGPLPESWCFMSSVIRNDLSIVFVLSYDTISIMRWDPFFRNICFQIRNLQYIGRVVNKEYHALG